MAGLLVVVLVLWFGLRLTIAQWLLDDALADLGIDGSRAEVTEIGIGHAVLIDVDVPGVGTVPRIDARYSAGSLLDGRIESLHIERPVLRLTLDSGGAPQGPLAPLLGSDDGRAGGIPVNNLTIEGALIELEAAGQWAHATLDAAYAFAPDDGGTATWRAETGYGTLSGEAAFRGIAAGQPAADLTFAAERIGVAGAFAEALGGRAELTVADGLRAHVTLRAGGTEIDGRALGPLALSGTWTGEAGSFDLDVGGSDSAAMARLTATVAAGASPTWSLGGLVAASEDIVLPLGHPVTVIAPTRVELDLAGSFPAAGDWSAATGGGTVRIEGAGLDGAAGSVGTLSAGLRLEVADGALGFVLDRPFEIAAIVPAEGPTLLPARIDSLTLPAGGLSGRVAPAEGGGIAVDASLTDLRAAGPDGVDGRLTGTARATRLADGTLERLTLRNLDLQLAGPFLGITASGRLGITGQAEAMPGSLAAAVDIDADLDRLVIEGVTGQDVTLTLPLRVEGGGWSSLAAHAEPVALMGAGRLELGDVTVEGLLAELPLGAAYEDGTFTLTLLDAGWLDVAAARHPGARTADAVSLKLEADALPLLRIADVPGNRMWDTRMVVAETAVRLELLGDDGVTTMTVAGTTPGLRISASRLGIDHVQGTAEAYGGNLRLEGPDVAVSGLELMASYNDGLSPWPQIQALGTDLRDLREPARFAPATADISVKPVWPLGEDVRMSVDLHMAGVRHIANVETSWEPARDRLRAYLLLPPVKFGPDLQPADLSPLWGRLLTGATGSIEITGEVGIERDDPFGTLDLYINDIGGTLAGAEVEGLAGQIRLTDIAPLRTAPDQRLTAAVIDPGLPMENLELVFSLPGNGAAWLSAATLDFAGGTVAAEPATYDPGRAENRVTLDVSGVDLARLAALFDMPELQATGRLSGTIPVLIAEGDIAIEGGRLATGEPGVLRYLPEGGKAIAGGDENIELVVDALSNFQYQALAVDIDRALGGSSIVGLHIAGANPELYDGYPIELNVNLTGDLDRIVRDSLAGWRIPEEIRQRLSGF